MEEYQSLKDFSMMQEGPPYKSYIKTIWGKVYLTVLSPHSGKAEGLILEGDPRKGEEKCIVDVWSVREDSYLRKANPDHFLTGTVIPYVRTEIKVVTEEEKYNTLSDSEINDLLNSKFFALQSAVNKMTSEAVLFRILSRAKDLEKSEKVVKFIEGRLASIQMGE